MSGPLLSLRGAGFAYGERTVFDDVDLDVGGGEIVTVLGTNGSGKSTLLRCLGGVLRLTRGRAALDGRDLGDVPDAERARSVAFLFQEHSPALPFSVREVVQLGRTPHVTWLGATGASDRDAVDAAMTEAGIAGLADRPYTALSGGERQLVLLARALAQQPRAILMDEPTSHLDLANQVRCLRSIRSLADRGVAVVVSTHDPNHAFVLGGRAVLMKAGARPLAGPTSGILTADTLGETYGIPITIGELPRRPGRDGADPQRFCSPW